MDAVCEKLKALEGTHPVKQFTWKIPKSGPLVIPNEITENFARNVYLKENFSQHLADDAVLANHYWVIRDWGGIRSFKQDANGRNDKRIRRFIGELEPGTLTKDSFSTIASFSKVASFMDPAKYSIYDARAIYALNWILFKYGGQNQLFPQPIGRNGAVSSLDQQTIFSLSKRRVTYVGHETAYHEYCSLLRGLAESVHGKGARPYLIEMLLFRIAPTWTIEDMRASVSLSIV